MNYKESTVTGSAWVRCRCVTITNPLVPVPDPFTGVLRGPQAFFQEERVVALDGGNILTDTGACQVGFAPGATIPLLDMQTGNPTGAAVTHGELYAILYSLYMQVALARDAAA